MVTDPDLRGEVADATTGVSERARQLANVFTYGAVLWFSGLAGSGALSGDSIGVIANRYQSFFLPADYVFGIWALIYAWLLLFTVYQALQHRLDRGLFLRDVRPGAHRHDRPSGNTDHHPKARRSR
jgi:hypothetical protein